MRRLSTASVFLAHVGALAFAACGRDVASRGVASPTTGFAAAEARADAALAGAGAPGAAPARQAPPRTASAPPPAALDAGERPGPPFEPAAEVGFVVRVVHAAGGERAAGAEVLYLDVETLAPAELVELELGVADLDAFARAHGRRFRTGADGEVRVPTAEWEAHVLAEHRGARGVARNADDRVALVTVELHATPPLRARGVDAAGAPVADAGVRLRALRGGREVAFRERARTGADGIATFPIAPLRLRLERERLPDLRAELSLDAVLVDLPATPIALDALPTEPVELVLPPVGSVVVQLADDRGTAPIGRWTVELFAVDQQGSTHAGSIVQAFCEPDGSARFDAVGLGLALRANAESVGGEWEDVEVDLAGPRAAGERVAVLLPVPGEHVLLTGRLLDPEGAPTALGALPLGEEYASEDGDGGDRSHSLQPDATGAFSLEIDPERVDEPGTLTLRFGPAHDGARHLSARVAVPLPLHSGARDLGDVRLARLPVIASGRVVDTEGRPLPGFDVELQCEYANGWGAVFEDTVAGRSGADGSFVLTGDFDAVLAELDEGARLAAVAQGPTHCQPAPVPFVPGAQDVLLVLEPFGGVAGRVLLDERSPQTWLAFTAPGKGLLGLWPRWESDGTFESQHVRPGVYAADLHVGGRSVVGARIEGVVVRSGEVTRDPRLDPLDLRGRVRAIVVTVRDAEGELVSGAQVAVRLPGEAARWWQDTVDGGATVQLVSPAVDLEVRAKGHRTAHVLGVSTDATVTLGPALSFDVRVADPPPIEDGYDLWLWLRRESDAPGWGARFTGVLADGRVAVELPDDGRLIATWWVPAACGEGYWSPVDFPAQPIDVTDPPRETTLAAPPAAAVAAAVARLRELEAQER